MKKYIFTTFFFSLCLLMVNAQVKTPAASPFSKVEQSVGMTDVSIEYSRPSAKDRTIFGDLVPYDKKWRTGANRATKIDFSTDVNVGGVDLKAGKYALYSMPGSNSWTFYFYTDTSGGGVPSDWDESKVAASFQVSPKRSSDMIETFLINVNNLRNDGATIDLGWENTVVSIPLSVPSDDIVMESIEKTMAGPSAGDYYNAARYYRESGKDLNKALEWMNKSLEMNGERFWTLRQKALLLADMGKMDKAIEVAKRSIELAKEAGNEDYVKNNEKSIKQWMK